MLIQFGLYKDKHGARAQKLWTGTNRYRVMSCLGNSCSLPRYSIYWVKAVLVNSCSSVSKGSDELHVH